MKIVLVESTHHVRDDLTLHLREQGHEVIAFARGRAAMGQIACYQADLVVVGETLIDMDGAAVAAHLRHWSAKPALPVLVVRSPETTGRTSSASKLQQDMAIGTILWLARDAN